MHYLNEKMREMLMLIDMQTLNTKYYVKREETVETTATVMMKTTKGNVRRVMKLIQMDWSMLI